MLVVYFSDLHYVLDFILIFSIVEEFRGINKQDVGRPCLISLNIGKFKLRQFEYFNGF